MVFYSVCIPCFLDLVPMLINSDWCCIMATVNRNDHGMQLCLCHIDIFFGYISGSETSGLYDIFNF